MKIHIVKDGDTLYELSKKYGVPLQTLIEANPQFSNPDSLMIGDKVKIPSSAVAVGHEDGDQEEGVIYKHVVKQGDTLWKLSKAWGVSLQSLIAANPQLKNPNALLVGEFVNIPSGGASTETEIGTGTGGTGHNGKKNTAPKPPTAPVVPAPEPTPVPEPAPAPPEAVMPAPPMPEEPAIPIPIAPEKPNTNYHYEIEYSEIVVQQPTHFEYVPVMPEQHVPVSPVKEEPCGCSEIKPEANVHMPNQPFAPNVASYYDFPNVPFSNTSPAYTAPANISPANVEPYAPNFVSPTEAWPNMAPNLAPTNLAPTNLAPTNIAPANLAPTNLAPTNIGPINAAPTNLAPVNVGPAGYLPNLAPTFIAPDNAAPTNVSPNYISPVNYGPSYYPHPNLSPIGFTPNMPPVNAGPAYVSPMSYSPSNLSPANMAPNLYPSSIAPVQGELNVNNSYPETNAYSGYPGISNEPYGENTPSAVSPEMYAPQPNMYIPQPCGCEGTSVGDVHIQPYPYAQQENGWGWNSPYPMTNDHDVMGMGMGMGMGSPAYQAPQWNTPQGGYPYGGGVPDYTYMPGMQGSSGMPGMPGMPGMSPMTGSGYSPSMGYGMPYGSTVPGAPIGGMGMRENGDNGAGASAGTEQNEIQDTFSEQEALIKNESEKVKVSTEPGNKRNNKKQTRPQDKNAKSRNTSNKSKASRRNPWIGN